MKAFKLIVLCLFLATILQHVKTTFALDSVDYPGNETDHSALLAIKSQLVDHPEGILSSWNHSIHHCKWDGVICGHKHKRVIGLELHSSGLSGTISPFIGNLSFLKQVKLYNNSLYGLVPREIGRLFRLKSLALTNNTLIGGIPANLSGCINLQALSLSGNELGGNLPIELSTFTKLRIIGLFQNNLTGLLFKVIQNLTSLEQIYAADNAFTGTIPDSIAGMRNLSIVVLAVNLLTGRIPPSIFNLSSLQCLELGGNQLEGNIMAPDIDLQLPLIRVLNLNLNYLTGPFPIHFLNLTNLDSLALGMNRFTGSVPLDFRQFHDLSYLDLTAMNLRGDISFISTLANCSNLEVIQLEGNKFTGAVPESVANVSSTLYWLNIGQNQIGGNIPAGEIPNGLYKCSALQYFHIEGNSIHGSIPSSFSALSSLQTLDLSRNNLSGPVPSYFSKFPLVYLNLSYNDFEGSVPNKGIYTNVSGVSLVGNKRLCGGIQQLHLPRCMEAGKRKNRRRVSLAFKLTIPIICALIALLAMAIWFYLARRGKKRDSMPSTLAKGEGFLRVSYSMLLKATDEFSSTNLLGAGTFGTVFKGVLDEKMVAVKVLNLQQRGATKSFMAECKALRNTRHRNLLKIITVCSGTDFQRNNFKALVYEFMPKGNLDRWLHEIGNLTLLKRMNIAIDVAHALNYLHHENETPIVHCDLKPSNILLDDDMVAHVGDFGLAKFFAQPGLRNQSSSIGVKGSVGYTAPEYGLGSEASAEGDIYSYGIVLLELITGKRPTEQMFREDFNLHMYAEAALPDLVLRIVDPTLQHNDITEEVDSRRAIQDTTERRVESMFSMVSVGVACSNHLPHDRMKITDAISRLRAARDNLLTAERRSRFYD